MPNPWNNPFFPSMTRAMQKEFPYCGPAVLEMLLSNLGVGVSQNQLIEAAGVGARIVQYGMNVYEMGEAVTKLFPNLRFWFKDEGAISDLKRIITEHKTPVGIEWQGDFPELDSEQVNQYGYNAEDEDEDTGHYGIVTNVDTLDNAVYIADPFGPFAGKDRKFTVIEFEKRWWDVNEIIDPKSGKHRHVHDYRLLFVVTPQDSIWPESLGMVKGQGCC